MQRKVAAGVKIEMRITAASPRGGGTQEKTAAE
jgi:hypothetical protein